MTTTRYVLPRQSWANEETAALAPTMLVRGKVEQIAVRVNDNTGNRTVTLTITDEHNGQLYTKAAIPEAATTVYKATSDASDFDAFLADGPLTLTLEPSDDPGASGMTVDVALYAIHTGRQSQRVY